MIASRISQFIFPFVLLLFILLLMLQSSTVLAKSFYSPDNPLIIKIMPKHSQADATHDYQVSLLHLVLNKAKIYHYKIEFSETFSSQARAMRLLNVSDFIDVVAAAPSIERDAMYHSIKVPLFLGLLGYRVLIIRKDRLAQFSQLKTAEDLKNLIACQATHWPDSDILEANNYHVMRVLNFDSMFSMVLNNRCDYFPRSITEGYAEIEAYSKHNNNDELMIFDQVILQYKLPLYFFTQSENDTLIAILSEGLNQAVEDGSLIELMKKHSMTKHLFPLSQWQDKTFFHLSNPFFSTKTPKTNSNLWINLAPEKHLKNPF